DTFVDVSEIADDAPTSRPWSTEERNLAELRNPDLEQDYDQRFAGDFRAEYHARLSTPLYCIAFALLAALLMLSATTQRRGYAKRIILISCLAGGLRILGFITRSVATDAPWADPIQYAIPLLTIVICSVGLINPSGLRLFARRPEAMA
ncbi:MAG: LptF/LptG family permease, partial [Pseudomonadota bacterium]